MSYRVSERRPRSVSPASSRHHHRHRSSRHGHHKRQHSPSSFSMDLLRTAVSAIGGAVATGRDDGQHHHHRRHYDDHAAPPSGHKASDQVLETLVQAAYTLGEVVGDFERKLGIAHDKPESPRHGRASSRIVELDDDDDNDDDDDDDWEPEEYHHYYETGGTPVPPPPVPPGSRASQFRDSGNAAGEPYYSYPGVSPPSPIPTAYYPHPQYQHPSVASPPLTPPPAQRPAPLRRVSSNPELSAPRRRRSSHRSSPPKSQHHRSPSKDKTKPRTPSEIILRSLPGLITRAAFVLELLELRRKHRDGEGMAAKYAALLIALKVVKQVRREYRMVGERGGGKKGGGKKGR